MLKCVKMILFLLKKLRNTGRQGGGEIVRPLRPLERNVDMGLHF